jgi:hypothetical protein
MKKCSLQAVEIVFVGCCFTSLPDGSFPGLAPGSQPPAFLGVKGQIQPGWQVSTLE